MSTIKNDKAASERKTKEQIVIEMYNNDAFKIPTKSVMVTGKQILGSRSSQQDSFDTSDNTVAYFSDKKRAWAVVCDGMGGMASGDLASQIARDVVKQVLYSSLLEDEVPAVLRQAINIANENVKGISGEAESAGTTLVCAVIEDNKLYYASVGDSRIYIYRAGEFVQITRDHNYMMELLELVEKGKITLEEANRDPQKEALVSYIGLNKLSIVDVSETPVTLQSGDVILLCSDGLTKALTNDEILELINYNYDNIDTMVDSLLFDAQATKPTGLDNTTIAIMKYVEN